MIRPIMLVDLDDQLVECEWIGLVDSYFHSLSHCDGPNAIASLIR
jgi:hypothetical protein